MRQPGSWETHRALAITIKSSWESKGMWREYVGREFETMNVNNLLGTEPLSLQRKGGINGTVGVCARR
jgi:hypothetical protein